MYTGLKHIAKKLIRDAVLKKNESFFRALISKSYAGNAQQCNICEFKLKYFVKRKNGDLLCPNCGSLSRTRRLFETLNALEVKGTLLHFSPPKSLTTKLKSKENVKYITTDFVGEFETDFHFDITAITAENHSFDFIICYHVLEHIEADAKAMSELYRVLKPNGMCLIQTPFKDGDIYEDFSITSKAERERAFGQDDHVRIYSVEGLNSRLQRAGFETDIITFEVTQPNRYGFRPETMIKAIKPSA